MSRSLRLYSACGESTRGPVRGRAGKPGPPKSAAHTVVASLGAGWNKLLPSEMLTDGVFSDRPAVLFNATLGQGS